MTHEAELITAIYELTQAVTSAGTGLLIVIFGAGLGIVISISLLR